MAKKEHELAQAILYQFQEGKNLAALTYCMTRLRITPHQAKEVNEDQLRSIPGVLGVVESSGQYQIILGPGIVNRVAAIISNKTGLKAGEVQDLQAAIKDKNRTPFKMFLRRLANIFIPLIPAIVAAGMIMGLTNVAIYSFDLDKDGNMVKLLMALSKAVLAYLAIFVGINTAREFGGTPILGGAAGALIILPDIAEIQLFGEALTVGRGGLIGALLAAWFISVIERSLRKIVPASIDIIVTPTLALLTTGLATYVVLQPLGGWLSTGITESLDFLFQQGGAISGAIIAGTFLPIVMTGLHQGFIPIHMELLNSTGIDPLYPIQAMAGAGQVGAAFAIYFKTKNKVLQNAIKGALPVGMLGIGEPLIFGVTLPLGRPFITACLGGAVGGAAVAIWKVSSIAIGVSGLPHAFLIQEGQAWLYLAGVLISYVAGFLITYFFGFKEEMAQNYVQSESAKAV